MNLALLWCWKEWRGQRALLAAYSVLIFASLVCLFLLMPEHFWHSEGNRAHVLSWFVAAGVIGVLGFAVPQLVRGEFTTKDDGFVRRLPGALRPAFWGKLLFLALASATLPLLGLVLGQLFLTAIDKPWDDLFISSANAFVEVYANWPVVMVVAAWGMALVPWVWAVACWLPGGRMAVGGTALLALLLGLGVFAVFRRCEGLQYTLAWRPWAHAFVPFGVLVAGISWVRGRRGGGNRRSAGKGLGVLGIGLVPVATWLGSSAYEYHHPDLGNLAYVNVEGLSPDQRFALARGTSHQGWQPVALRIDLQSGSVEQIGGVHTWFNKELLRPFNGLAPLQRRFWHLVDHDANVHALYDLQSGERFSVEFDDKARELILPATLREPVVIEGRASWPFRAPGGLRACVVDGELLLEQPDGSVRREAWPVAWLRSSLQPAGHGMLVWTGDGRQLYDLTRMQAVAPPGIKEPGGYAVRGIWVMHVSGTGRSSDQWRRFDSATGGVEPCPELKGCGIIGLFDDDRLLCQFQRKNSTQLFLYRPADRSVTELQLPAAFRPDDWRILNVSRLTNAMDRLGRIWLQHNSRKVGARGRVGYVTIDPATLALGGRIISLLRDPGALGMQELVEVLDEHNVLVREGAVIARVDTDTGARTVLFPRQR